MMGSDARDMMGLPSAGPSKPAQPKAPKPKVRGPTGMSREVLDLNYEGAPPISIVAPKFKEKPKLPFKPRAWEETPFGNSARKDGLIFKHWRRKGDTTNVGQLPVTPADSNAASEMDQDDKATTIPDAHWAKYNVRILRPQYTDEQYDQNMKREDWSREETDYLVDLAIEFDLRWIVIADRYDYRPREAAEQSEDSMAVTVQSIPRSQEDLKARYYTVAAKAMVLRIPEDKMSASEFEAHTKMTKYDSQQEKRRKLYVEQLLARTEEEKHEEEFLLKELSRIVLNQEKLFNERKALYERLEAPKTTQNDNYSTTMYQSSAGLTQLMQMQVSQSRSRELDKKAKRQSAMNPEEIARENERHRPSLDGNKRASVGGTTSTPQQRRLHPREQQRYGVTYPTNERLVGGVAFRNERAQKAAQAKSSVQTTRINAALSELHMPPKLGMPTIKVVAEYEKLIDVIKGLLEVRKVTEKVESETKVLTAQKEAEEAKARGEEVVEKKEVDAETKVEEEEEEEEDNNEEEAKRREAEKDTDDEDDAEGETQNNEEDDEENEGDGEGEENAQAELALNDIADDEDDDGDPKAEADDDDGAENEEDEEREEDAEAEADAEGDDDDDEDAEAADAEADAQIEEPDDDEEDVEAELEEEEEEEEDGEGEDAEEEDDAPSPAPTARSTRKRSASVTSAISSKRQKNTEVIGIEVIGIEVIGIEVIGIEVIGIEVMALFPSASYNPASPDGKIPGATE